MFTLSESHMSIHTWPEYGSCAIDFYNCGETSNDNCRLVRNHLKNVLGENNVTSDLCIPRGQTRILTTNIDDDQCSIYKNVSLLHREKSPQQ